MRDRHANAVHTIIFDRPDLRREKGPNGCHRVVTATLDSGFVFDDAIPSWNVGGGFRARIRVRAAASGTWSNWRSIGTWGDAPPEMDASPMSDVADRARIDVDRLCADEPLDAVQLAFDSTRPVDVERIALCLARSRETEAADAPPKTLGPVDLSVPFRSQHDAPASIARRICSPTCVAMLLAYQGIDVPVEDVAAACYDAEHDIYGNWNRAIQAAFTFGLAGAVHRMTNWEEAADHLRAGLPVIASIAFEEGELPGVPLPRTNGHLVVIRGIDADIAIVNDPAQPSGAGPVRYSLAALGRAWFGHGGVAYVFDGPTAGATSRARP